MAGVGRRAPLGAESAVSVATPTAASSGGSNGDAGFRAAETTSDNSYVSIKAYNVGRAHCSVLVLTKLRLMHQEAYVVLVNGMNGTDSMWELSSGACEGAGPSRWRDLGLRVPRIVQGILGRGGEGVRYPTGAHSVSYLMVEGEGGRENNSDEGSTRLRRPNGWGFGGGG